MSRVPARSPPADSCRGVPGSLPPARAVTACHGSGPVPVQPRLITAAGSVTVPAGSTGPASPGPGPAAAAAGGPVTQ
jgi:hypothetical protein